MAVTTQTKAPYTAGAAVLNVIRRYRDKGLTTPIISDVLVRAGVSETLVPRTLAALITLELIDEQGQPTETFQRIRSVPEAEYKAALAEWLRSVYAEVFSFVDPAADDSKQVRDAFRSYEPYGQQDRMVALFLALCAEAGLAPESKKSEPRASTRKPKSASRVATPRSQRERLSTATGRNNAPNALKDGVLPPALMGILQSITPFIQQGWTQSTRDKFMATFGAVLDFVVTIKTEKELNASAGEDDDWEQRGGRPND